MIKKSLVFVLVLVLAGIPAFAQIETQTETQIETAPPGQPSPPPAQSQTQARQRTSVLLARPAEGEPMIFNYGWRGLFLGTLAGLAGGYLRYVDEDDNADAILKSVGYGTIAGAGVGVLLGFVDVESGRKGMGDIILQDMYLGGGFGTAVGTIWGGINALSNDDWESVGKGASWGYLSGIVFGTIVALYEGPRILSEQRGTVSRAVSYQLATAYDSALKPYARWSIDYRFF